MKTYNEEWMSWDFDEENYMIFDDDFNVIQRIELSELEPKKYILEYGKYKGKSIAEINAEDPEYLEWVRGKVDNDLLLKQCLDNL